MLFHPPIKFLARNSQAGFNAQHRLFGITIKRGLKYGSAILAQEIVEWNYLNVRGLLTGAALGGAFALGSSSLLIGLAAFVPGFLLGRKLFAKRGMEYLGHAVEWRAAVRFLGADSDQYLASEVKSLDYYKFFKGTSKEERTNGIVKNAKKADKWLDKHWTKIEKLYA